MSGIVGEIEIAGMKPVAELNKSLPPAVPPTANLPPPMDDNAVRAMFQEADRQGIDDLKAPIQAPQGMGQPQAPSAVPDKFRRPDGTVDEEKLNNSSKQLDEAIDAKRKSIDEILSDYKGKQREYTQLSQRKSDLERQPQAPPQYMPPPQQMPPQDMNAVQAQIAQDYQRDPIGTTIMLTQAMMQRELGQRLAPIEQGIQSWQESQRDAQMRNNLAQLAQSDPRILDPRYYSLVQQVMAEDPEIYRLRNPHKAAWNEVKERLRLGASPSDAAQPSNPTPMLGQGAPPFVPKVASSLSPQSLSQVAQSVSPYTQEGRQFEEQLKVATKDLWQ